jgi:phenylpropionate dioxygenase-like ring-hydroxylating dioxygenase large terminal subunit
MRNPLHLASLALPPLTVDLEAEADLTRCGALKDYWYVACRSAELTPRKPLARTIFGTNLVLFRDEHRHPAALRDRCLHRNARLSAGATFHGKLGCPYHGWVYDAAGNVVEVPSLGPSQRGEVLDERGHAQSGLQVEPSKLGRVQSFAAREQDGLIYVFMGEDEAKARAEPFRVPYQGHPDWTVYFMVTRFPNGVTNLVENFMDVPHTVFVHSGLFRNRTRKRVPATVKRSGGNVRITYRQDRDSIAGLVDKLFNPRGLPMVHTDQYFAPNITRVDYMWGEHGFVINSQVTPIGPTDSLVYTAISFRVPLELPGRLVGRALAPVLKWYTTQVIRQDVEIMRVQKEGLLNGPGGGVFTGTEADLLHSDIEAYRRWLREGAQGPGPSDEERDIVFWI